MRNYDIDAELLIVPHGNGIRLLRPDKVLALDGQNYMSLQEAYALPCNIFFMDTENKLRGINELGCKALQHESEKVLIGKTIERVVTKSSADSIEYNNKEVIIQNKKKIVDELPEFKNKLGLNQHYLTIKVPWYNDKNQTLGVFGTAILLGEYPLAESLAGIAKMGILDNSKKLLCTITQDVYLTPREKEVSYWLIRGKTSKEIGELLQLSRRTVENYLENMKTKMNVKSKSELVEKLLSFK